MKLPVRFPVVLAVLFLAIAPAASNAGTVIFEDDTFADSDWTVTDDLLGNGGSSGGSQSAGGIVGDCRRISIFVNGTAGPEAGVWSFHAKAGAVYNPAAYGGILFIKYIEYSISLATVQSCGMALRQDGVIYYGPRFINTTSWLGTIQNALTASSFDVLTPAGQHPNFSATGGPIEFGFVRANSTPAGSYSTLGAIDNWYVEITTDFPVATEKTTWGQIKALYRD